MSDLREMFFEECDDLLEGLSTGLTALEGDTGDDETINSMFRSVHSIKGGAGAFGMDRLIEFAHAFENVLDLLRSDKLQVDGPITALMFLATDHLSDLVNAARDEIDLPASEGLSVLSDLKLVTQDPGAAPTAVADAQEEDVTGFVPLTLDLGDAFTELPDISGAITECAFDISFAAEPALYANGHDPALLFRTLSKMGELSISADTSAIKPLEADTGELAALSWSLHLVPDEGVNEEAVREVFEFVEGLCQLTITTCSPDDAPELSIPEDTEAVDHLPAVTDAPTKAAAAVGAKKKSDEARNATIRVDLKRVDRLINLVGELVISEAMLRQSIDELPRSANSAVSEAMGQLKQLSGSLQESVMAIRAQPVRSLFQRMSRIVRESAREAGKTARLVMVGEATEVDKTVTERLVEPLTHMIRNSVDHGLETPQDRIEAGKPEQGIIRLEAAHKSGRVVISLSDDGAGINRAKVRAIAEEKGLVRPEEDLTDTDIDNLLFRPGFSTATEVSNLSGRGVGMDVVRNEIQALGGRIALFSEQGRGTKLTISLPLTLAVMEGMVVTVAGESLVVPTLSLRETLQPGQADIHAFCDEDRALSLGGDLIPIIDLGASLGFRPVLTDFSDQSILLIEGDSGRRTALAVDGIIDQREVVIKGLEQNYQQITGIAAATILGDGKIALIVDTDQVITSPGVSMPSRQIRPELNGVPQHV